MKIASMELKNKNSPYIRGFELLLIHGDKTILRDFETITILLWTTAEIFSHHKSKQYFCRCFFNLDA